MVSVIGINGFGRIGKCCFLQLIDDISVQVKCINATNLKINEIEDYLKYDSTHKLYNRIFSFKILNESTFQINHHIITLISERDPAHINWKKYDCNIIIEATGSFLTTDKCNKHNVNHVIITSPAKDDTPTYVYGVNHLNYKGEKIISASSCTTNSLAPMLRILSDAYGVKNAIFTTIHASTASQNVVDIVDQKARTSRSIFNNIIPHSTGASSSISFVLPKLDGKVFGTSVRVPVVNCSLLDLNIELETNTTLQEICDLIKSDEFYGTVYAISSKKLVSNDFSTTTSPTILDVKSSIEVGNGRFKLMIWYDNEWSYSTQIIRMVKEITNYENRSIIKNTNILQKYYIRNMSFNNRKVVCRFDFNVPRNKDGLITDDFRITSTISTINYIKNQKPKYILLVSHFGRPKGYEENKSLKFIVETLEKNLKSPIIFLSKGISIETKNVLDGVEDNSCPIYLLENIRFHEEETNYENMTDAEILSNPIINLYKSFGDTFICDAFGCMHRKHMSIHIISKCDKYGYGDLVKKEIENISVILDDNKKKLGIIGGNKIKDKMPLIDLIKNMKNTTLFVGGKIATEYTIDSNDKNVYKMTDGYGGISLDDAYHYIPDIMNANMNVYDIGDESLKELYKLIDNSDLIFWNGSLGVIENPFYVIGSEKVISYLMNFYLMNYLKYQQKKTIIVGGGDTSSLINNYKDKNDAIYLSTGGGALLEFLENISKNKGYLVGLDFFTK